uniref:YeeE/YedE family protein n=1 Tax=Pseudomonas viridiflava TaxID=33069 RepID=UPI0013DF9FA0
VYGLVASLPAVTLEADTTVLVVAGLLVGIGTRYGAGCTSGHGVCGLSRRSPRSMAATATFMLAGFATVYVMRHLLA